VVTWNRLAEQCNQFLTKGRLAYVEGRLRTRSWESQDGQKHYRTEVIANRVTFLDRQASSLAHEEKPDEATGGDIEPEDIPF
jgi:single-strand DNA-binding protein